MYTKKTLYHILNSTFYILNSKFHIVCCVYIGPQPVQGRRLL